MPEKVVLDHTPAYTFGLKVKQEKFNDSPGIPFAILKLIEDIILDLVSHSKTILAPGTYMPEKVNLDHTPSYTFGIKHNQNQRLVK